MDEWFERRPARGQGVIPQRLPTCPILTHYTHGGQGASASGQSTTVQESAMTDHVYKTIELTGSSTTGTDAAIRAAVARAAKTIRHMDWFQVVETRGHIEDGAIAHWQVTVKIGFRMED
jgi:flavin-binding protein dodecin